MKKSFGYAREKSYPHVPDVAKTHSSRWKSRSSTSQKTRISQWYKEQPSSGARNRILQLGTRLVVYLPVAKSSHRRSSGKRRRSRRDPVGRTLNMENRSYRPGDRVPASGIYRVEHSPHRLMHVVTLMGSTRFPVCRRCSRSVRFFLVRKVKSSQVLPFRSNTYLEDYTILRPDLLRVS